MVHSHISTQTKHHTYNIKTNLKKNKLKYAAPFPFLTSKPPRYICMLRCREPNFLLQLRIFFFLLPFETVSFFETKLAYSLLCLRLASNSRLISFLSLLGAANYNLSLQKYLFYCFPSQKDCPPDPLFVKCFSKSLKSTNASLCFYTNL